MSEGKRTRDRFSSSYGFHGHFMSLDSGRIRFSCAHVDVLSESRILSGYLWRRRAPLTTSLSLHPHRHLQFCISESQCCFILPLVSLFEPLFLAPRHNQRPWWYTDWGKLCQVQHQRHRGPARLANEAAAAISSPFNSLRLSICSLLKWNTHPLGFSADGLPGLCPARQQPPHSGPICQPRALPPTHLLITQSHTQRPTNTRLHTAVATLICPSI